MESCVSFAAEMLEHVERRAIDASKNLQELLELRAKISCIDRHLGRLMELIQKTPEFGAVKSGSYPKDLMEIVCDALERFLQAPTTPTTVSVTVQPAEEVPGEEPKSP